MAAREVLDQIGVGQKYCNEIIGKVYKIGNNLGLPEPALADTLEGLEEEIEEDIGVAVKARLTRKALIFCLSLLLLTSLRNRMLMD